MKKVSIISRQSDNPSLDIRMLRDALLETGEYEVSVLCKMLSGNYFSYLLHMTEQLKEIMSSDVLVVDGYCILNSLLPHPRRLKTIQMWHALSAIKQYGWQTMGKADGSSPVIARIMRMHAGYDYVLSSSDVTAKHFCQGFKVDPSRIVKLGLPRIDYILRKDSPEAQAARERYHDIPWGDGRTVLYVPTFRKGRAVDVRGLYEALSSRGFRLIVKLHPLDKAAENLPEGVIIDREYTSYDLLKLADIVISDYSSYVVEASLADKPLYLYTYDKDEYMQTTGLNVDYDNEAIRGAAYRSPEALAEAIAGGDYDYAALRAFRDKYIDISTENCTAKLVQFINSIV